MRPRDQVLEPVAVLLREAELIQRQDHVRPIEDTHDDPFAVCGRDCADTNVDVLAGDLSADTTVLREPLLAMFRPAMIFTRAMIEDCACFGASTFL